MARQISSMDVVDRRNAAQAFTGQRVRVSFRKAWHEPLVGTVVTVACSTGGQTADVLVLDTHGPDYFPLAISLATVRVIAEVAS
jgi:regulator of RNase E activity RraA